MKTTADYLDALRARFEARSDYALRIPTGWHPQHISRYRTLNGTFDDVTAMKVAEWLGIDAAEIMVNMDVQREKRADVRAVRTRIAQRFTATLVLLVLAAVQFAQLLPADSALTAHAFFGFLALPDLHIMRISVILAATCVLAVILAARRCRGLPPQPSTPLIAF